MVPAINPQRALKFTINFACCQEMIPSPSIRINKFNQRFVAAEHPLQIIRHTTTHAELLAIIKTTLDAANPAVPTSTFESRWLVATIPYSRYATGKEPHSLRNQERLDALYLQYVNANTDHEASILVHVAAPAAEAAPAAAKGGAAKKKGAEKDAALDALDQFVAEFIPKMREEYSCAERCGGALGVCLPFEGKHLCVDIQMARKWAELFYKEYTELELIGQQDDDELFTVSLYKSPNTGAFDPRNARTPGPRAPALRPPFPAPAPPPAAIPAPAPAYPDIHFHFGGEDGGNLAANAFGLGNAAAAAGGRGGRGGRNRDVDENGLGNRSSSPAPGEDLEDFSEYVLEKCGKISGLELGMWEQAIVRTEASLENLKRSDRDVTKEDWTGLAPAQGGLSAASLGRMKDCAERYHKAKKEGWEPRELHH